MLPSMTKIALVLHRDPALSRREFLRRYEQADRSAGRALATRQTIHLPHETDALRAAPAGHPPQPARCDGLSFQWIDAAAPPPMPIEEPREAIERIDAYRVKEVIHWDTLGDRPAGERSPGIKMIAFVRRLPELSSSEFRERYLEHAAIARHHHPGIARYVQNFVTTALTDEAPQLDGIAELHFATEADLTGRFHRDESSVKVVGADVARFMSMRGAWSILATEYVVR